LVISSLTIFLGTSHPTKIQVKKAPKGNKISEVRKSQKLRNDFPNTVISTAPHDKEQNIPIQTPGVPSNQIGPPHLKTPYLRGFTPRRMI
jgi:hypothetical protein